MNLPLSPRATRRPVQNSGSVRINVDRALVVNGTTEEVSSEQLMAQARVTVPAIMNYLFFTRAQVAVLYLGKRIVDGKKYGIPSGAHDMKIKMIRFLMSEIWPALLRTDTPDESLGRTPTTTEEQRAKGDICGSPTTAQESSEELRIKEELLMERSWFQKSVASGMQVLVYLKRGVDGSEYLKLILSNSSHRIHFDIADPKEEKYRWEMRMLFTRILDNLETQKGIDSYESYEFLFRSACAFAAQHQLFLERPEQPMVELVYRDSGTGTDRAERRPVQDARARSQQRSRSTSVFRRTRGTAAATPSLIPSSLSSEPPVTLSPSLTSKVSPVFTSDADYMLPCVEHKPVNKKYQWMHTMEQPESATLDYKSYFAQPDVEIEHRSVKFMCGFLNTYGEGKLVIGIHEIQLKCIETLVSNSTQRSQKDTSSEGTKVSSKARSSSTKSTKDSKQKKRSSTEKHQKPSARKTEDDTMDDTMDDEATERDVEEMDMSHANVTPATAAAFAALLNKGNGNDIVLHNDLIEQFVVGVAITDEALSHLQEEISTQLLECIPPIPPQTVHLDVFPVAMPEGLTHSTRVLLFYEPLVGTSFSSNSSGRSSGRSAVSRDYFKQKSNLAIRYLFQYGLSIAPIGDDDFETYLGNCEEIADVEWEVAQAFVIVPLSSAFIDVMDSDDVWEENLKNELRCSRGKPKGMVIHYSKENAVPIPPLRIVEVSVDIKRCGFPALTKYAGKFFSGWPSIPIWDPATATIRRVERNYNLLQDHPRFQTPAGGQTRSASRLNALPVTSPTSGGAPDDASHLDSVMQIPTWTTQPKIANTILGFLYDQMAINDVLEFRHVSRVCNIVFEARQGIHLIMMMRSTPLGTPQFTSSPDLVSRMQYALHRSNIPLLPLALCRVFETIGALPSPYPYVAVPLSLQSFRVASSLIPLLYHQKYYDGNLKPTIVLDVRDGYIKTLRPKGNELLLEVIVGVKFDTILNRQLLQYTKKRRQTAPQPKKRHQRFSAAGKSKLASRGAHRDPSAISAVSLRDNDVGGRRSILRGFLSRHSVRLPRHTEDNLLLHPQQRAHNEDDEYAGGWTQMDLLRSQSSFFLQPAVSSYSFTLDREMEANIPLLHFSFITVNTSGNAAGGNGYAEPCQVNPQTAAAAAVDQPPRPLDGFSTVLGGVIDCSNVALMNPSTPPLAPQPYKTANTHNPTTPHADRDPWTLQHLLSWLNTATNDSHVRSFGYCDRSFAFYPHSLHDICMDHVEKLEEATGLSEKDFAPSCKDCLLHRVENYWRGV